MSESKTNPYRVKLDVLPRTVAAMDKPGRRFQAHLKLRGKLTGKELIRVVRRVRSVIRWAKNKLEREGYGITRACYAVSESLSTDLQDLTDFVDDNRSFLTEDEQLWRDNPTEYWKKQDAKSDA